MKNFFRYTKLSTWFILLAVVIGVILILTYSGDDQGPYQSATPVTDSLVTAAYPDLYEAVYQRDAQALKPFLSHQSQEVRRQAWRAFANTPVDSLSAFLKRAKQQNSEAAWFGISQHSVPQNQLRRLEKSWQQNPIFRPGISRVLGQQGDAESLDFLLNQLDESNLGSEYQLSLAIGRLINRFGIGGDEQIQVLQHAFDADNYEITRAYLYGWYRGDDSRLSAAAQDTLFKRWQILGAGTRAEVDQYINEILPERTTSNMIIYYNGQQRLEHEVQLSVELAKSLDEISMDSRNSLAAKILLANSNPHVQGQTLESLQGKVSEGGDLYGHITGTMIPDSTLANPVWLQAMETAAATEPGIVSDYKKRLETIPQENKYLMSGVLAVYEQTASPDEFLQRIRQVVNNNESLPVMHALQSLEHYWENLAKDSRTEPRVQQVRSIIFQALQMQDRGVTFTAESLLRSEELFNIGDFKRINRALNTFSLPADIEVYQSFGSLYKARFEQQAKPVIDSLAALNYAPLNRSLADAGWDVEAPEKSQTNFYRPDWERLWELGRHPEWTLRTEKGAITIRLNTLAAPATVSAIDSLSRAGAYDGVPFHRVVPNFVVQGGDFERQDGFGGPDFVLPTEASEQGFGPGAIGIASAGTDTEGSQYFLMHQWKPHLNGSYTRFGSVTERMEVVHQIVEGDRVLSTMWY